MIKQHRRFDFFLQDIEAAMRRILEYTEKKSYADFTENNQLRDAVIRNFEIIGESVKHIPFHFQKQYKHIPWYHMFSLRNFIVHEFFDVDDEILWSIIQHDLKKNLHDIQRIISDHAANDYYSQINNPSFE
jgi:uncharacterized protein with HEPN domain